MELILQGILFISLYTQVFLFVTFFEMRAERRKSLALHTRSRADDAALPRAAIIVPCWNEAGHIARTIDSLLALDYPREKFSLIIVDDGSTDATFAQASQYSAHPQVTLLHKENGGKHTALNLAIESIDQSVDIIGCLDADSYVEPQALREIAREFENSEVMAVTPLIRVSDPRTLMERVQSVEYVVSSFLRDVLGAINALFVTPGPFSFYRRSVFEKIGRYRPAHQTEDLEIALRMHANGLRIANTTRAVVFTVAPKTFGKLFRQRVRWQYGFMKNTYDYRRLLLQPRFGHVALFGLPAGVIAVATSLLVFAHTIIDVARSALEQYFKILTVGVQFHWPNSFSWFYIPTSPFMFLSFLTICFFIAMLWAGYFNVERKHGVPKHTLYFLALYGLMAPLWYGRALYNVVFIRRTWWR